MRYLYLSFYEWCLEMCDAHNWFTEFIGLSPLSPATHGRPQSIRQWFVEFCTQPKPCRPHEYECWFIRDFTTDLNYCELNEHIADVSGLLFEFHMLRPTFKQWLIEFFSVQPAAN